MSKPIQIPRKLRVLINAASSAAWYDVDNKKLRKEVSNQMRAVCQMWKETPGVKFITSFDDDLFMTGDPRGFQRWSIYIIFDVEDLKTVAMMVDAFRHGDIPLNRYFTITATIGRPFFPIEAIEDPI